MSASRGTAVQVRGNADAAILLALPGTGAMTGGGRMRVVYTYEGERDPSFEDAMLGVVGDLGPARQLASVAAVNGVRAVTLEVTPAGGDRPSGDPTEDLVRRLRAHERVVDVTPEGSDRLY